MVETSDGPLRPRKPSGSRTTDTSLPPAPEPLAVPVADSHCHLDIGERHGDEPGSWRSPAEAIAAAAAVGVTRIVQVGCELPSARWSVELARTFESVVAAVALHPNEAAVLAEAGELDAALAEIDALAADPAVRAVGETGLDYFRTGESGHAAQHRSFREHIAMAKRHDKTLQIHDRDAHDDVLRILEEEGAPERVVFHCFSGDAEMARHCTDRGWYLSFAGTVTFKNAVALREALVDSPVASLLVETDAPYLTPTPHRGRTNASYLIPLTLRAMAEARRMDVDELAAAVDANTDRAFGGSWPQAAAAN